MFQVTTLNLNKVPCGEDGSVDFGADFFGKPTHLTVSGQLEAELAALALSDVYTFGPTFRAENSNTTRHLAEFWMIEPEMAFQDLTDNMELATDFLKYLVRFALEEQAADLKFLNDKYDEDPIRRLPRKRRTDFVRLTYTEAVDILDLRPQFEYPWSGGTDLQSEHERYLVEEHFHKPVILYDYPKDIKAFYMRLNDDDRTVRAMDVLFPGIGEIIGGSQREERYDVLLRRIREMNLPEANYWWYLDTQRYGFVPGSVSAGSFERLLPSSPARAISSMPFPSWPPGNAESLEALF